jgi:uncharacterized Zn-finger protein
MSNVGLGPGGIGLKIEPVKQVDNFGFTPTIISNQPKIIQQPPQPVLVFQRPINPVSSYVPYTANANQLFQGYHFLDSTSMRKQPPTFLTPIIQLGGTHACIMCPARFTSKRLLAQHRIEAHLARTHIHKNPRKNSSNPSLKITKLQDLNQIKPLLQQFKKEEEQIYFCCGKSFLKKKSLYSHMRSRHTQVMTCDICSRTCLTKQQMIQHVLKHLKSNKCETCKRFFVSHRNLMRHIEKCAAEKESLICHECGTKFKRLRYLKYHINRVHNTRYICEFCGKGFGLLNELLNHERRHTGVRPYTCDFCNKAFHTKVAMSDHVMTHIMPHNLECDVCGKKFNIKANLTNHRITHFKELKRYECSLCNAKFHFNSSLQKHLVSHTQEKPFQCSSCEKLFTRKASLRMHMNIYHGSKDIAEFKKFPCTMCDKTFMAKNQLARHVYTHTGERPFQCDLCAQRFVQMSQLRTHKMLRHKILPYECSKCGERFKIKSDMMAHFIGH